MNILKWIKRNLRFERVLFADLDGTIIVTKSGKTFPENCDDWQFKKGIISAIKKYNPTHLHIVSNQGGIEKGFVDKDAFFWKINKIQEQLKKALPNTRVTYDYCTSNDPNDDRRKPNCGMIDFYCTDVYNNTDCLKRNCLMIGDASGLKGQFSDSDRKCAENAGIKYIDVDYFLKWADPCGHCDCNNAKDCKYAQGDPNIVASFPCNQDLSLSYWKNVYEKCRAGEDVQMLPCK